jgi:Ca2+-binding EF-hand superfamily protein
MNDEKAVLQLAEIERIIKEFREKFESKTSNPDDFITISEIEKMWRELRNSTNSIYSDMLMDMMNNVDESSLIRKKKDSTTNTE